MDTVGEVPWKLGTDQETRTLDPTDLDPDLDSGSGGSLEQTLFATTPQKALLLQEIDRTRTFVWFALSLVITVIIALNFIGGDPTARLVHQVSVGGIGLFSLWILWVIREPDRYRPSYNVIFGMVCVTCMAGPFYYWGPFSAVLLVIPFGAHLFSMSESFRGALLVNATVMLIHIVLSCLLIFDVVQDRSLIAMPDISRGAQLVVLAMIQLVFVATFAVARGLRRGSVRSHNQLARAAQAVARRDALLLEAKQSLNRALQIGGPGPYTGQTIGSFLIGNILGRGAMGEVYEAKRQGTGEQCAVKLLHPHVLSSPHHYQRFLREQEIMISLRVPNVVRVLEVSRGSETVPYIAMERLYGEDLASYMRGHTRLAVDNVCEMIEQVGAGLAAAHDKGVVHRDLKPQNLYRSRGDDGGDVWKVLDFGVSKLQGSGDESLTAGHVVGTPSYMAPEQARGKEVDHRADIYSLGVIAYRALTGMPAFTGPDIPEIMHAVVYDMPARPSTVAKLPTAVDSVMAIALAKRAEDRFDSGAELAKHLREASRGIISPALDARAQRLLSKLPWRSRAASHHA